MPSETTNQETKSGQKKLQQFLTNLGIPAVVISVAISIYTFYFKGNDDNIIIDFIDKIEQKEATTENKTEDNTVEILPKGEEEALDFIEVLEDYLPTSTTNLVINYDHFSLSFSDAHKQSEWMAYELSYNLLEQKVATRHSSFSEDKNIKTGSAKPSDYTKSGYDRGHLVPAADMAFSEIGMRQSFLMSNVSPQLPAFNRGVWKELEEQVRDWVKANRHMYIITGAILTKPEIDRIGRNKQIPVPSHFYKVLLDLKLPEQKGIAFIIPNQKSTLPLSDYMVTIDSVETLTGITFFPSLPDDLKKQVKSTFSPFRWIYDEDRYKMRLSLWNEAAERSSYLE